MEAALQAQMEAAYALQLAQMSGVPAAGPYGLASDGISLASGHKLAKANKGASLPATDWGIPGFDEALTEAVMPINEAVSAFSPDQLAAIENIKGNIGTKIIKAAKKFVTDERCQANGTALQARALVEEFVEWAAGAVSQAFFDKPWLEKVNLAAPLLAAALHTFNGSKIFTRTLAPMLPKYIEEGLFKYAEEERITKAMWDAVVASGVKETHQKKASQHLAKAYDTAHAKAPYGTTVAANAELGMLQDFVKGWMLEFCTLGGDLLKNGIGEGKNTPDRGEQILFLTILFQNLTDARNAALPHELTSLIETPPPSPWAFISECSEAVFNEVEAANAAKAAPTGWNAAGWAAGAAVGAAAAPAMDPAMMAQCMGMMQQMFGGAAPAVPAAPPAIGNGGGTIASQWDGNGGGKGW